MPYRHVDDLASVWCEWAEMEIRHEYVQRLSLIVRGFLVLRALLPLGDERCWSSVSISSALLAETTRPLSS